MTIEGFGCACSISAMILSGWAIFSIVLREVTGKGTLSMITLAVALVAVVVVFILLWWADRGF